MLNCKKHPSKILALFSLIILLPVVFSLALLVMVEAVHAATLTVNTAVDENDGECGTDCSLRDAIALAANGDTITFSGSYTIYLNSQLDVTKTLTIDGSGHMVTVSGDSGGDGTRDVRVFYIDSNGVVTMTHLNIVSGTTTGYGGGIYNDDGTLTLSDSAISGNSADQGGGMYNLSGNLRLANVTFITNTAYSGAGLYNSSSSPALTYVTFRANSATNGGGMYNESSSPALTNVTFISNTTTYYGGGMYNVLGSSPTLANVTFSGNSTGSGGSGGGMYNESSSPMLTDVTFSGNSADFGAGLGNVFSSNPTLTRVTFTGNSAIYGGGGVYNHTSSPTLADVAFISNAATYTSTSAAGGGMYNEASSSPTLTNVTFISNTVTYHGGGMYNLNNSSPKLTDVTFRANSATRSIDGVGGGMYNTSSSPVLTNVAFISNTAVGYEGGGMFNTSSNSTLTNVTFSGNSAATYGGGLCNRNSSPTLTNITFNGNFTMEGWGGGMYSQSGSPQVRNSIFWGDTAKYGANHEIYNDPSALTISDSVVEGGCPGGATTCTNVITTNPQLGALGYYGGRTPTLPLLAGSSAIDTGNDAVCPATDQRGVARPQGEHCDIGAFEAFPLSLAKSVTPALNAPYHGVVTYTIILANIGALSDTATIFTDTLPDGVDFGSWLDNPGAVAFNDVITWTGTLTNQTVLTFTFTAMHTGGYGDVITNTASFSGTTQTGRATAAFAVVASGSVFTYLPVILKNVAP